MSKTSSTPAVQFPPYGFMNNDDMKSLGSKHVIGSPSEPVVPPEFEEPASCKGSAREHCWSQLRDEIVAAIADNLWPIWDVSSRTWTGAAVKNMERLTVADLRILMRIRVGANLPINSIPGANPQALDCPTHMIFFQEEDQSKVFVSYAFYDRILGPETVSVFGNAFFAGIDAKCSSTQYQFKQHFQRPRPFQMAFLMGETDFNLEEAITSMTPSMISGHSLQGLIGTGAVMERIIQSNVALKDDSWQALRQYAVDIGDRRVMAGVHYPSDNLGSWIVLMRLAPHIFRRPEVKRQLWQAITEQSFVYRQIVDSGAEGYEGGLELLNRLKPFE